MFSAIDLFCGAGGLSLGLQNAGFNVRVAVDSDPVAIETYQNNLGKHARVGDLTQLTPEDLLKEARLAPGECDLLAGGPPCQGFSVQRRGEDNDARNHLIFDYLRFIKGILPRFFLMENVGGLLSKRGRPYFDTLKAETQRAGYKVHVEKMNAVQFGVPQERSRIFIVGERTINSKHGPFSFPAPFLSPEEYMTVRQTISNLPSPPADGSPHKEYSLHYREARLSKENLERFLHIPEGGGRDDLPPHLQLPCHVNNPSHRHKDVYGRMSWDRPAPTLTARFDSFSRGRFGHPAEHRTITLREGARLQTFPDSFHFAGNRGQVARQIGNAVPPKLAEAIAKNIAESLTYLVFNDEHNCYTEIEEQLFLSEAGVR